MSGHDFDESQTVAGVDFQWRDVSARSGDVGGDVSAVWGGMFLAVLGVLAGFAIVRKGYRWVLGRM